MNTPAAIPLDADALVRDAIAAGTSIRLARKAREAMVYGTPSRAARARLVWDACCRAMRSSITDEIALSLPPAPLHPEVYAELVEAGR